MERTLADKIGMLATVMNALAVSDKLEQLGVPTEVFTSITMPQVAPAFTRKDALRAMEEGKIAVFGGGTGNPFFSTDTATALRAVEVSADVMFKATMVDGVYDKEPHKYPDAKKYDTLTFTKVLEDQLAVMDGTAAPSAGTTSSRFRSSIWPNRTTSRRLCRARTSARWSTRAEHSPQPITIE